MPAAVGAVAMTGVLAGTPAAVGAVAFPGGVEGGAEAGLFVGAFDDDPDVAFPVGLLDGDAAAEGRYEENSKCFVSKHAKLFRVDLTQSLHYARSKHVPDAKTVHARHRSICPACFRRRPARAVRRQSRRTGYTAPRASRAVG